MQEHLKDTSCTSVLLNENLFIPETYLISFAHHMRVYSLQIRECDF